MAVLEDWLVIGLLIAINALVDSILVAYLAGLRSKKALVLYLNSKESDPLWTKQSDRIRRDLEPEIRAIGTMEARITAHIPPNVHGELEEIRGGFAAFDKKADEAFTRVFTMVDEIPRLIRLEMAGEQGRQLASLQANLKAEGKELSEKAMAALPQANAFQQQVVKWINSPLPKNTRDNPAAAAFTLWLKNQAMRGLSNGSEVLGIVTGSGNESGGFAPSW